MQNSAYLGGREISNVCINVHLLSTNLHPRCWVSLGKAYWFPPTPSTGLHLFFSFGMDMICLYSFIMQHIAACA